MDFGDPYVFLRSAISPPEDVAVTNALLFLESLSAVVVNNLDTTRNTSGKDISFDLDSEITPLGYHLAALPINPRIGKLMLYGVILECIDPILTIASTLSSNSVFVSPFSERDAADEAKLRFLDGNSDLLTFLNAINSWKSLYSSGNSSKNDNSRNNNRNNSTGPAAVGSNATQAAPTPTLAPSRPALSEMEYCRANFLNVNSMRMIDQMRSQFLNLLKDIGFMPPSVTLENISRSAQNSNGTNVGLIKCAICAGLSPNILQVPGLSSRNLGKKLAEIPLQSRIAGLMRVHPSSVMSEAKYLDSNYLVYLEAIRTSQVYVRDITTIPPLVLALFSGRSKVHRLTGAVTVDGWIHFRTPSLKVSQCILQVRDAMDDAFMQKVLDPSSETSAEWRKILKCIRGAVSTI